MITLRDRHAQNLFDPWESLGQKRRNLLDCCWAGIFRNYRQWVIEKELDGELFEKLTDKLIKAFSIDTDHQRIDSTGVQSAMRTMTRLGILVATITKFLKELAFRQPDFYAQVDQVTVDRFIKREGKCFGFGRPSEAKQQLPRRCPNNGKPSL